MRNQELIYYHFLALHILYSVILYPVNLPLNVGEFLLQSLFDLLKVTGQWKVALYNVELALSIGGVGLHLQSYLYQSSDTIANGRKVYCVAQVSRFPLSPLFLGWHKATLKGIGGFHSEPLRDFEDFLKSAWFCVSNKIWAPD